MHAQLAYTTALWTTLFVAAVITPASALPVQVVVGAERTAKSKNRGQRRGAGGAISRDAASKPALVALASLTDKENRMTMPDSVAADTVTASPEKSSHGRRDLTLALWRGLLGRCPKCGKGAMFRAYLRVNPRCPVCYEDLSPQRADDAPAYLTLLIVCHVVGAGVLLSDPRAPLIVAVSFWLAVTVLMSLLILPRMKGAVVGYQWALRMHGFGSPSPE
jgi:uncharacterized protein (DUF983 family)